MKKYFFLSLLALTSLQLQAQDDDEDEKPKEKFFKKDQLFTGGSATVSFFNGTSVLGLSPYFGYSINRFVDVAVNINWNYVSQRDAFAAGDKIRQTVLGPGAFLRVYPLSFLFAQAQYERNYITQKYIAPRNSGILNDKQKFSATSYLVGGGISNGRQDVGDPFYYFSVMWDVKKEFNSPYTDNQNRAVPVITAGLQIPLFQTQRSSKGSRRGDRNRRFADDY
jgi:hypothetical protein